MSHKVLPALKSITIDNPYSIDPNEPIYGRFIVDKHKNSDVFSPKTNLYQELLKKSKIEMKGFES